MEDYVSVSEYILIEFKNILIWLLESQYALSHSL